MMWEEEDKLVRVTEGRRSGTTMRTLPSPPISSTPVRFDAPKRKSTYRVMPYVPVGEQV
jgi:hypothetical protein